MMLTFRAGNVAALTVFLFLAAACSREQQDWRSAEAADTVEGYSHFLERHPDSELATEARTRVAQLAEDHEWQQASQADTADAYRQFMTQHPNGKWSQEARIRIQNFALNGLPPTAPPMAETPDAGATGSNTPATAAPAAGGSAAGGPAPGGVPSISPSAAASAAASPSSASRAGASPSVAGSTSPAAQAFAAPGELAQPVGSARSSTVALSTPYVSAPNPAKPAAALASANAANIASTNTAVNNAAATNATATNTTSYGIQLGAFASAAAANGAWQQLTGRFGTQLQGLSAQVVPASTTTGTLFRLQALVGDESRARALCDLLKKQSQACVPVLPH